MAKLVLFDIDGTMLDSSRAGRDAMEEALMSITGSRGDPSYWYDGKTDRQIVRELLRLEGLPEDEIDSKIDVVVGSYLEHLKANLAQPDRVVKTHPGVIELVNATEADDDTTVGLLTGNVRDGACLKLIAAGVDPTRFAVSAFGCDHEVRNELAAIACRRHEEIFGFDVEGDEIIIIGDTPADIECGRPVNARTIAVATGRFSVEELSQHKPHAVFADLSDTRAVMEAIYA